MENDVQVLYSSIDNIDNISGFRIPDVKDKEHNPYETLVSEVSTLKTNFNSLSKDMDFIKRLLTELLEEKRISPRAKIDSKLDASVGNYQQLLSQNKKILEQITLLTNNNTTLLCISNMMCEKINHLQHNIIEKMNT
jgi:hypothetical protein